MTPPDDTFVSDRPSEASFRGDGSIAGLLEAGLDEGLFTTAAAIGGTPSENTIVETVGRPAPDADAPTTVETPFDLASLTKPIVTTTIFFRLLEEGALTMTDTLDRFIPETEGTKLGRVPLRALVTHTSGVAPYRFSESWNDRADAIESILGDPPFDRPIDDSFEYSCLNYVLLATVLRRVTDSTLAGLADVHVFGPADMETATIGPYDSPPNPVAVTYEHEYRDRPLRNEIHDPIANVMDGESGNAGAFATVRDVASFARSLLRDATEPTEQTLLATPTVGTLPVRRSGTETKAQGYGWRVATDLIPTPQWSGRTIGHTGYTGTSLWLSFDRDRFATLLTNAVYEDGDLYRFRQRFHAIVASSL